MVTLAASDRALVVGEFVRGDDAFARLVTRPDVKPGEPAHGLYWVVMPVPAELEMTGFDAGAFAFKQASRVQQAVERDETWPFESVGVHRTVIEWIRTWVWDYVSRLED